MITSSRQNKLDCGQGAQTSAKASNFNQKWSDIWIQIFRLIQIPIRMSCLLHRCENVDSLSCWR